MLKYEKRRQLQKASLIVKNIKESDFTTFSCEAKGVRLSAALLREPEFQKTNVFVFLKKIANKF